jgi:general secretion pathway protein D
VRLREGEVNVLGGLRQEQISKTISGVPGLASIPLLGRLFSGETTSKSEQELLFVLIPHIVRTQEITDTNLRGISTGNDTVIKLNYSRPSAAVSAPAAAPAAGASASGTAPAAPPATAPPIAAAPPTPPPPPQPTAAPQPAQPATPTAPARITFSPPQAEGQLGAAITVTVNVENATDLFTVPLRVTFDPKIVRLNDVVPGNLLTSDGKQLLPPSKNIQNDNGEASVVLTRAPGAGGVTGSGALATFVFQAVGRGTANIAFPDLALRNSQLQQAPASVAPLAIIVK